MNAPLLPGRIEHWPLARLRPYARNAKTHDADQVAKIAASMAEFGWTVPCLVAADGELIAGHGRVLAAAQLGLAEAPVIVLGHLTEAQRRAYRIADNKLTELGGWDEALLLEELRGLMAEDFDLGLIGIPEDELDALLHDADDRAPIDDDTADTIPEAPAEPITRPGDIWALGDHRLICGDATDPAVVARLMDGAQASLMFTSPPYAQQRDYGAAKEKVGDWDALMQGVFAAAPVTADAQLLVNLGLVHRDGEWIPYWEGWVDWMRAQGWRRFGWYVWDQGPGLPGDWNGRLAPSHEFIFHFNRQPGSRTRRSRASTRAKPSAAAACAGPTARSIARPATATRSRATASRTACSGSCATRAGWARPDRTRPCSPWRWSRRCWRPSPIPATWCSNPSAAPAPS
jgi:ParB-like chromosome segregation protein Spo0J